MQSLAYDYTIYYTQLARHDIPGMSHALMGHPTPRVSLFFLTDRQDSSLLLVHLGAGDEGEDALVDLIQNTAIVLRGKLTELCRHETLQIARRTEPHVILPALQAVYKMQLAAMRGFVLVHRHCVIWALQQTTATSST